MTYIHRKITHIVRRAFFSTQAPSTHYRLTALRRRRARRLPQQLRLVDDGDDLVCTLPFMQMCFPMQTVGAGAPSLLTGLNFTNAPSLTYALRPYHLRLSRPTLNTVRWLSFAPPPMYKCIVET